MNDYTVTLTEADLDMFDFNEEERGVLLGQKVVYSGDRVEGFKQMAKKPGRSIHWTESARMLALLYLVQKNFGTPGKPNTLKFKQEEGP